MTRRGAATLALHGLIVLFLGLLCGMPYGAAIVGAWGEEPVRAWKLAHMEGVQNGILVLAPPALRASSLSARSEGSSSGARSSRPTATSSACDRRSPATAGSRRRPARQRAVFVAFMFGMWGADRRAAVGYGVLAWLRSGRA
jgi:hypothetical protein